MMKDVRVVTVCVDYADALDLSLAFSQPHVKSRTVVTHPRDEETIGVVRKHGAELVLTEVFYQRGADFNKFAALEEGLDLMGREGWIAIMDADILLPPVMPEWQKDVGCLYVPHRRMFPFVLSRPEDVPANWLAYKRHMVDEEFAGYCQIFHADDAMLGPAPWHDVNWTWAGGPDSFFHQKWPRQNQIRPPFDVMHMGPTSLNWAGRTTRFADGRTPEHAGQRSARRKEILSGRQRLSREGEDVFSGEKLK